MDGTDSRLGNMYCADSKHYFPLLLHHKAPCLECRFCFIAYEVHIFIFRMSLIGKKHILVKFNTKVYYM
jgi:hypothetical protein